MSIIDFIEALKTDNYLEYLKNIRKIIEAGRLLNLEQFQKVIAHHKVEDKWLYPLLVVVDLDSEAIKDFLKELGVYEKIYKVEQKLLKKGNKSVKIDPQQIDKTLKKLENLDKHIAYRFLKTLNEWELAIVIKKIAERNYKHLVSVLACFLKHKSPRVRANTVEALEKLLEPDRLVKFLRYMIKDSNNRVKANAALALWRTTGLQGMGILEEMLKNGDIKTKASAAYALGKIGTDLAFFVLSKIYPTENPMVDRNIITAIANCDTPLKVDFLLSIDYMNLSQDCFIRYVKALKQLSSVSDRIKGKLNELMNLKGKLGVIAKSVIKGLLD